MRKSFLAALVLAMVAATSRLSRAADVPVSAERGVLLLNNGQLIEGTVTAAGDRYDVARADGEIRIRRSQVEFIGRDADECYRYKRSRVDIGRAQDFLDLAEWCLRNNLLDAAEREIASSKAVDKTHPKVALLEARLRLAREKPEQRTPTKAAPASKPARELPDAVVRNLPAGSVEAFTNHIQPLLLNNCARAGCHGLQSVGNLRLERIPPNRYAGRKSTQRNLQSVLSLVDRAQPEASKLLTVTVRPHGPARKVVFTDREQEQYKQLVQWVYQLSGTKEPAAPPTVAGHTATLLEHGPRRDVAAEDDVATQRRASHGKSQAEPPQQTSGTSWSDHFPDQKAELAPRPAEIPRRRTARGQRLDDPEATDVADEKVSSESPPPDTGVADTKTPSDVSNTRRLPAGFVPKDAFDPELFNRRYFK